MMKLRWSPGSPYVRKVMVMAHEIGLVDQLELIPTNPWDAETDIGEDNPLGKVPCLILEDETNIFDSLLICEYLDDLHSGTHLFPRANRELHWLALRLHAAAQGILDAAVACRIEETFRPTNYRWDDWIDRQKVVIGRGLDFLEGEAENLSGRVTIGHLAIGCALGYLEFRQPDDNWLAERPDLADWFDRFNLRPSMEATQPRDR